MADPAEPLETVLRRLKDERDDADARYNAALASLDRAVRPPAAIPSPVPALDEEQLAALNEGWNILPAPPQASGVRAKLTGYIWRVIGPYLQRQLAFNSRLVDHLNRQANRHREAHRAAEAATAALRDELAGMAEFQGRLMQYLQQITAYVDTKDRDTAGGALVLNASLSGMAENLGKRFESMAAREHRYEARTGAIADSQQQLLGTLGTLQNGFMTVKREVERIARSGAAAPDSPGSGIGDPGSVPAVREPEAERVFAPVLDSYKYVGFEDQFRGSREAIRARFESYVPLFEGRTDLLDVGCGRGEFLDLLGARGIPARGRRRSIPSWLPWASMARSNHATCTSCRAASSDVWRSRASCCWSPAWSSSTSRPPASISPCRRPCSA